MIDARRLDAVEEALEKNNVVLSQLIDQDEEQELLLMARIALEAQKRLGPAGMEVLRLANWAHRHAIPTLEVMRLGCCEVGDENQVRVERALKNCPEMKVSEDKP